MTWFADLKLNSKFDLILSILLIALLFLTALLTYRDQQGLVLNLALEQGRGVARQIDATTDYMSDAVDRELENNFSLVPQVVATQVAKRISTGSQYTIRQVSQNFRNPDNRPDAYESNQLKAFSITEEDERYEMTEEGGEETFRYMHSMIAEPSCLECHGAYESAPLFIQQRYPRDHPSYDYQVGQVVGAISISIPMANLQSAVAANLKHELFYRVGILVLALMAMRVLIRRFMINPIQLTSATIHRVTATGNLAERIPAKASKDEVGQLIGDFNGMMEELDRTTLQRQESEDRYRNLIESTDSAIVTFLANGKIIISNHKAERLLGLSRNELLGESIFDYLEQGESLQERINAIVQKRDGQGAAKTKQRIRDVKGQIIDVEISLLLASRSEHKPMLTAILRKVGA